MKKYFLLCALLPAFLHAADAQPVPSDKMPPGVSSNYEVLQGKVLKVYKAQEGEAKFLAYVVEWKGQEVVVSDALSMTEYKEGDQLSFMVQAVEIEPQGQITKKVHSLNFAVIPSTLPK